MSKPYFDFEYSRSRHRDDEGMDLPDVEAARMEVLKTLADITKDALPKCDQQAFSGSIRDVAGNVIYRAEVTVSGEWYGPRSA